VEEIAFEITLFGNFQTLTLDLVIQNTVV